MDVDVDETTTSIQRDLSGTPNMASAKLQLRTLTTYEIADFAKEHPISCSESLGGVIGMLADTETTSNSHLDQPFNQKQKQYGHDG